MDAELTDRLARTSQGALRYVVAREHLLFERAGVQDGVLLSPAELRGWLQVLAFDLPATDGLPTLDNAIGVWLNQIDQITAPEQEENHEPLMLQAVHAEQAPLDPLRDHLRRQRSRASEREVVAPASRASRPAPRSRAGVDGRAGRPDFPGGAPATTAAQRRLS